MREIFLNVSMIGQSFYEGWAIFSMDILYILVKTAEEKRRNDLWSTSATHRSFSPLYSLKTLFLKSFITTLLGFMTMRKPLIGEPTLIFYFGHFNCDFIILIELLNLFVSSLKKRLFLDPILDPTHNTYRKLTILDKCRQ